MLLFTSEKIIISCQFNNMQIIFTKLKIAIIDHINSVAGHGTFKQDL